MELKVKKLHPEAILPTYATDGSACFDLYAMIHDVQETPKGKLVIDRERVLGSSASLIRTGLAFEIPTGHAMLIYSRSGHGFKSDVRLSNCVGVIDSDYRGEVIVKLRNDQRDAEFMVRHGDRVAQAMLIPVEQVQFVLSDELSETERGSGGFGSTGA